MEPQSLWVDTDMGGDIDDAFALSLALHSPELRLRGISTVYRGNEWRLGIVREMLRAYGREEIPVYLGAESPLLGRWNEEVSPALPNEAPQALIQALRREPELAVVAIGPLTNVALALKIAPDVAPGRRLYVMGGVFGEDRAEWNIACDPEAARIVLESGADITLVGLDVTEGCTLTRPEAARLLQGEGGELAFLRGELERFFGLFAFDPVLHDPLTVAALLWEELFAFEAWDVAVETEGADRGKTRRGPAKSTGNVRVAAQVRAEEATERMCARIRAQG